MRRMLLSVFLAAALLTGCRCGKNGVTHNERFDPFHHVPVWYNQLSDIRCDTIFHAARRAGLHSCAARWPMTACGNGIIDYIVPEVLDADLQNGKSMRDVLAAGGSGPILEDIVNPNLCLLDGNRRPGYKGFQPCVKIDRRKHATASQYADMCAGIIRGGAYLWQSQHLVVPLAPEHKKRLT